jgi:hypothetical protein
MKKIFLTVCAGAMIHLAAMAQVQEDTTANDNNLTDMQTTPSEQQPGEDVERGRENPQDSVQQGVERTSGGVQQGVRDTTEQTNNAIERNADDTQSQMKEGIENTENAIQGEADKTGEAAKEAADETKNAVKEGAAETGEAIKEGTQRTKDAINDATAPEKTDSKDPRMETTTTEMAPAPGSGPKVEVVESKEGPMNEVVYKYKGEMFYVDRENSSIVKVEEGDLNDVGENKIVHKKEKIRKR